MSARLSKVVGVLTAEKFSSVSDSDPDSLIASEISLTAKLSGPIGMTIGLAPVDSKSAVKDRLKSIEPDNSILRNSAILKDNLEKKVKNNENIDNTKITEKTNCWQSKNVHSYLKRNFKCSLITKSFEEQKVRRKKLLLSHKTFKSPD
jgi:ferredoxin-fold anticodon binding domain-containing protein